MIGRFILRRVIIAFFQLLGVSLVVFFLIRMLPADPVAGLVGLNASEEAYAQAEKSLGLDKTILEQLSAFLGFSEEPGLIDASLGVSWTTSEPVFLEIGRFLPVTLELVTLSLLLSFLIAIPLGMASATKPGSIADKVALIWGMFAGAQPDYWWGLMFVFVFFYLLGVAPPPAQKFDAAALSPMAQSFWAENRLVRNDRIKRELGVTLRYPDYRAGLKALLAEEAGALK